jgi:Holliday junction resolvasome RuvABC DNA-binding subunit
MEQKRTAARRAAEARAHAPHRAPAEPAAAAAAPARAVAQEHAADVVKALRTLGCSAAEARRAAAFSATLPDATLEERVRAVLQCLGPKTRFHGRLGSSPGVP